MMSGIPLSPRERERVGRRKCMALSARHLDLNGKFLAGAEKHTLFMVSISPLEMNHLPGAISPTSLKSPATGSCHQQDALV